MDEDPVLDMEPHPPGEREPLAIPPEPHQVFRVGSGVSPAFYRFL